METFIMKFVVPSQDSNTESKKCVALVRAPGMMEARNKLDATLKSNLLLSKGKIVSIESLDSRIDGVTPTCIIFDDHLRD